MFIIYHIYIISITFRIFGELEAGNLLSTTQSKKNKNKLIHRLWYKQ